MKYAVFVLFEFMYLKLRKVRFENVGFRVCKVFGFVSF